VAVAKALAESPAAAGGNFVSLDLADNTFGQEGARALAAALQKQVRALHACDRDEYSWMAAAAALRACGGSCAIVCARSQSRGFGTK
jgi:hypothetical protein